MWDRLQLQFAFRLAADGEIAPLPRPDGTAGSLRCANDGELSLILDPYPFDEDRRTFPVEARLLEDRPTETPRSFSRPWRERLSHVYHEIENPYEFLSTLHRSLAPGARVAIIDNDKPTQSHGTPPKLLRCELGVVGYREAGFWSLSPADGYLMVFVPPARLPPVESIRPCKQ